MIEKAFTAADQLEFAELSGDFNPIHIDAVAARRFMFGRPVAHGIHVVLWALDQLLGQQGTTQLPNSRQIARLTATFRNPIVENKPVQLAISEAKASRRRLDVSANGVKLVTILVEFSEVPSEATPLAVLSRVSERGIPRDLDAAEVGAAAGSLPLCLEPSRMAHLFPAVARFLSADQTAALLATTRLVGMEAPGLHSLFTGLDLSLVEGNGQSELTYRAQDFDDRFSLLTLEVAAANLAGTVTAALRPSPRKQAGMTELQQLISPGEFSGERVLVIGGSRGLGEVAVKLLSAGGAQVRFTYHSGAADAHNVFKEITAAGGDAKCFAYDVSKDAANLAGLLDGWSPTLLCYFATPFIFSATTGQFNPKLFREFRDCYVDGFLNCFQAVRALSPELRGVLNPSSSAVDSTPANMGEYAAAKMAAESICVFLANQNRAIRFLAPRLPRLPTDQTASLLSVETADPAIVVRDLLGQFRK
jgi:NADP-dependent 3-hydroxy acid dehydrogenase YdfG